MPEQKGVPRIRGLASIRLRLVLTSTLLVLLVAAAVSVSSIMVGLATAREQAFRQLESVGKLKSNQIETWMSDLQHDLDSLFVEAYEVFRMRTLLLNIQTSNPTDARNTLRTGVSRTIERSMRFEEIFLIDLQGTVRMSTMIEREGQNYLDDEYFLGGLEGLYVGRPSYDAFVDEDSVMIARPAFDSYGELLGVIVGRANLDRLREVALERTGLGETGETYLVDEGHTLVTSLRHLSAEGTEIQVGLYTRNEALDKALFEKANQSADNYVSYHGESTLGWYFWLPQTRMVLAVEQKEEEVTAGAQLTLLLNTATAAGAVIVAAVAAVFIAQGITRPLNRLVDTASRVAEGDLSLTAPMHHEDEVGVLARAFNVMTGRLRELVGTLEDRVAQRTRDLEAAADVSRATTSVLDPKVLESQVVDLVRDRFGLYYVGLFMLDEAGAYAVLRAGTGEAGRQMLAQGHRLEVGGATMIGQCVEQNSQRIAQNVGEEVVRFNNPLLPDTRSELALPMRARGRVIGAMTLQSGREAAFDAQAISTLQTVADQLAVALDNAQNFAQMQTALERAHQVEQRYQGQAWGEYVRRRPVGGYEYLVGHEQIGGAFHPLGKDLLPEAAQALEVSTLEENQDLLVIPIRQGDRIVATLGFEKGTREWGRQDVALVQAVAEQFGLAAETQRLLDATQRRAAREQLTLRISEQVRGALDVEEILRVASRSLGRELQASEVIVRLGTEHTLLDDQGS